MIAPETVAALSRPRLSRWLAPALFDWAVIVAVFALARRVHHPAFYALSALPLGSRQQALGALFHDAAHRLASRNRTLNDALGNALCAFPLGLTLGGYRRYHFAHHRALGTDGDPEIAHKRAIPQWALPSRAARVALHFAGDLAGGGVPHLIAAGRLTRPVSVFEALCMSAQWILFLGISWRLHALWVPALWVASIATVFWSGVRLRIWTEHLGTRETHRITVPWWLEHFLFPHEIGLHWEHHTYASVPFWNLPRLRAALPPSAGAPPIASLTALSRAFAHAPALPSGHLGEVVRAAPDAHEEPVFKRYLTHVALPLALGAAVYVTCRRVPPHLLSGLPFQGALASRFGPLAGLLPDALWAYALAAFQTLVWRDGPRRAALLWALSAPAAVLLWEGAQRARWVPGTFDPIDVLTGLAACALAVLACRRPRPIPPTGDPSHAN